MNINLHSDKKFTVRPFLTLCATVLLTLAAASCDSPSEPLLPSAEGTASLSLRIEAPATTRVENVTDEEYAAFENRIRTLRVLVFSENGSILKNETFTAEELAATSGSYTHTVNGLPVGKVNIYLVANEGSIGQNYSNAGNFAPDMVITDDSRTHFPKRYSQLDNTDDALPMSAYQGEVDIQTGENTASLSLIRCVAKLRIEMVNELTRPITVNEMSFGTFMADRFYLFPQTTPSDVPDGITYDDIQYGSQDDTSQHLGIEIEGGATRVLVLYIYPSYAWTNGTDSPYTIGFRTPNATYARNQFFTGSNPLSYIARNTEVTIRALLHTDSNFTLDFAVEGWGTATIDVPSFD